MTKTVNHFTRVAQHSLARQTQSPAVSLEQLIYIRGTYIGKRYDKECGGQLDDVLRTGGQSND